MRILYVDIDSLRPDHLGCYGYSRPTSPTIDRLAAQGVLFTNYFCSDSPCVPSRAACFSGRPGIRNGVVAHENTSLGSTFRYTTAERNGDGPVLMHLLAKAGMQTVSFSSFANRHLAGWFHFGFRQFNLSSLKNGDENADEVNALALPWFRLHAKDDNWFVHLNYWEPHTLYTQPPEYAEAMARHPAPAWPDEATIRAHQDRTGIRTPRTLWQKNANNQEGKSPVASMPDELANRADFEHLINGYDGAIRFADEQLARVLNELERQGVLNETAIIISADHGEAFGELGQYMEHGTVSPSVQRVPLIVRWPGVTDAAAGSQNDALLYNIDLAPTIATALGLSIPRGWCGRSFLPLLRGQSAPESRDMLFLSHGLHTRQRGVFDGRYLYIRTYHPSYYLYPPRMLFDLSSDPNQTHDLAAADPQRVKRMDQALQAWIAEQVAATKQSDPMADVQVQPTFHLAPPELYLMRLRDQGREQDALRLKDQWARIDREYSPLN